MISETEFSVGDVLYFQKKHMDKAPKVDKVDLSLMIILWALAVWSIIATRISDPKMEMLSPTAQFWIDLTIPICTTTSALIESIQVAIEKHDENEFKKGILEMTTKMPRTITNNINVSSSNPIDTPNAHSLKQQVMSSAKSISFKQDEAVNTPRTESRTNFLLQNKLSDEVSVSSDETDNDEVIDFNKQTLEGYL